MEAEELEEVMRSRTDRPLLLIDLAVPRDIDPACGELDGVSLYDIDDLEAVIARNRTIRQAEARKAEGIIEEEIQGFATWLGALEIRPTIAALRVHAQQIATQAVRENDGKWESASARDLERIDALAQAIVNRILHTPTARMKETGDERVHQRMALIRDLFELSPDDATQPVAGGLVSDEAPRPLTSPRSAESAKSVADADRNPGQRAGADSGGVGRRSAAGTERSGDDHDSRRPGAAVRGQGPVGLGTRAGTARRADRYRGPFRQGRPRRTRRRIGDRRDPAREDPRDAICGVPSLAALPAGARVGTSSLRRRAQLLALRPDLEIVSIRGNVDTRLRKLADGEADALVLALAGLRRLGRESAADGILDDLLPAAGQGALAIEARPTPELRRSSRSSRTRTRLPACAPNGN